MTDKLDRELSFPTGHVINRSLVIIVAEVDRLAEAEPHSVVLQYMNGKWNNFKVSWPIVSVCDIEEDGTTLLSMGLDGRIHIAKANGFSEEQIDDSPEGPECTGILSEIRRINGTVYIVGMGRQAYRRIGPGQWQRIDQGLRIPLESEEIRGLASIDGFNQDDIYAVGDDGEIWHFDGREWSEIDSPTNMALHKILCVAPGDIYVAGQCGTLLLGRQNTWNVIHHGETEEDFWGLAHFQDKIYVASDRGVYIVADDGFESQSIGAEGRATGGKLHARDGVLWSFGTKFLSYTEGDKWTPVIAPRP